MQRAAFSLLLLCGLLCACSRQAHATITRYVASGCPNGATSYDPSGSGGAGSCSGGSAQVFSSVHNAFAAGVIAPGDILLLRAGTYTEPNDLFPPSGKEGAPITVARYQSETVVLQGSPIFQLSGVNWFILDGFIYDGAGIWLGNGSSHNIIRNIEIKNATSHGVQESSNEGPLGYNSFINLKIHDSGASYYDNAMYMNGSHGLYDGIEIYHTCGTAIQLYHSSGGSVDDNIVRNSYIHDTSGTWMANNRPQCLQPMQVDSGKGQGIVVRGSRNKLYNNVIANIDSTYHPCYYCGGIGIGDWGDDNEVYNNVITGMVEDAGIVTFEGVRNTVIKNNIVYRNTAYDIFDNSPSSTLANNLTSDPSFVDAGSGNYRVASGSAAIDAGTTVALVSTDKDGVPRPQGSAYDIGAYESGAAPAKPPEETTPPAQPPSTIQIECDLQNEEQQTYLCTIHGQAMMMLRQQKK